jgi:hypothetical protein
VAFPIDGLSSCASRRRLGRTKTSATLLVESGRDISSCTRYSHRPTRLDHTPVTRSCAARTGLYSPRAGLLGHYLSALSRQHNPSLNSSFCQVYYYLYIVHRMKALLTIPPLAGLDNFFSSAQAERSSAAPSGHSRRHDSGRARLRRARSGRARASVVPTRPFNPRHSEPLACALSRRGCARNLLFSSPIAPAATQKSKHPSPFRGEITIARHVIAGSATDRRSRSATLRMFV